METGDHPPSRSARRRATTGIVLKRSAWSMLPWCLSALLLLHAAPGIAKIIQIETQTSVTVSDGIVKVEVAATNKGDEPARNVRAHVALLGKSCTHRGKDLLREGESMTVSFGKIPSPAKPGTYPLITRITFQDVKGHPFSAVSCTTFPTGEGFASGLKCRGKAVSFTRDGLLKFTVTNRGATSRTIRATLVLPEEFSTHIPQRELSIDPRAKEAILFEISNFSALVGAVYPVFCYLEYDSGKAHYTEAAKSLVSIVASDNWFRRARVLWLCLAIITGVILVACQFKRKSA